MAILINGGTNDILIDGESVATDAEVTAQIGAIPAVDDASETVQGIIEIATDAEVQTGADATKAVTPAGLKSAVIGLGQTWQNVAASRAAGVTYTNSTGKPIMVSIEAEGPANACSISVNGVTITRAYTSTYSWATMATIVPNGSTYMVTSPVTIHIWQELR